ncbi:hypothetical protein SO802_022559 [Lithocarpus litseifolius]|uniref:Uncharacterized protein n=1 Tax=Lithocarpus litseifolius TaxID=425828 RepID=A0AAW2C3T1_9ROSI
MGQRLKSMKIWSVMVVSSGGEASEGGGGVVVVRESEVVERRRERQVNGCGCYIEAKSCKLLPELGSAEVWASSHNSMIIHRVQANRRTEVVIVIGVVGKDWTHKKHCH